MKNLFNTIPKRTVIYGFSLALVTFFGCYASNSTAVKMQVELDVFSGRPNPYWNLTPQETNEFVRLFQALPPNKEQGSIKEGLGYRGLIVTNNTKSLEDYNRIVISNGVVVASKNNHSKQFTDQKRRLERWLFQTGKGRIDNELYNQISKVIVLQ